MAKHLFLVRHAEAASAEARQDDKTRDLTQAGIKESLHLGAWLGENNFSFDLIVSSSAVRTEQTGAASRRAGSGSARRRAFPRARRNQGAHPDRADQ